jgi:hypothetical protein
MQTNIGQQKVLSISIIAVLTIATFHCFCRLESYGHLLYSSWQCNVHSWVLHYKNSVSVIAYSAARTTFRSFDVELIFIMNLLPNSVLKVPRPMP